MIKIKNTESDVLIEHYTAKDIKQVETVTIPATASATQGDFIIIENQSGGKFAVWLDIDSNGTAPSGTLYTATDNQTIVGIATGGSAIANAAAFKAAVDLDAGVTGITITDNEDGTLLIERTAGSCDDNVVKNSAENGAGSILSEVMINGVSPVLKKTTYLLKGSFNVISKDRSGEIIITTDAGDSHFNGGLVIKYSEVSDPTTTDINDLASQMKNGTVGTFI
jgi:hypothetical protein